MSDETPEWIRELSREDRNRIDNGIHPAFDTWKLHKHVGAIRETIGYLRAAHEECPSASTLALIEQLEAHIDLIDDRIAQIEQRKAEWTAWRPNNRDCIHGLIGCCGRCPPKQPRLSAEGQATYDRLLERYRR